jgi:hypothetical protein
MTALVEIDAYLSSIYLLCALACMGLIIGILSGLFGVGGAFLGVPMMNVLLGVAYPLAVSSSLSFIIGTSAAGLRRHWRLNNVEPRCMVVLAMGAACGAVLGDLLHVFLLHTVAGGDRRSFETIMHVLFIVLLMATAWLVYRGLREHHSGKTLIQRMRGGPRVHLPSAGLTDVNLIGLVIVGICVGVATGLMGVGGGVLFLPILILVVGLSAHQAVGTSLGVILFAATAGAIKKGLAGDNMAKLSIAMSLLVGSAVGVQIGAAICNAFHAQRLQRYFAFVVLVAAAVLVLDLVRKTTGW